MLVDDLYDKICVASLFQATFFFRKNTLTIFSATCRFRLASGRRSLRRFAAVLSQLRRGVRLEVGVAATRRTLRR